ncbi:MAG: molybdopterin-dependent oxidoreductase, partial [Yoonia sp.]
EMISFDDTDAKAMRGVQKVLPITGGIAVVADNTWRAIQAANAVEIEWGTAPYPAEMDAHWQALSDSFNEDQQDSRQRDDGDVVAAMDGADVIEAEYRAPYLAHAPLEPISAVVEVSEDRVDVWTGTQIPRFVQTKVSKMTGVDFDDVHVHVLMMGGSFGHRLEDRVVKEATEIAM